MLQRENSFNFLLFSNTCPLSFEQYHANSKSRITERVTYLGTDLFAQMSRRVLAVYLSIARALQEVTRPFKPRRIAAENMVGSGTKVL